MVGDSTRVYAGVSAEGKPACVADFWQCGTRHTACEFASSCNGSAQVCKCRLPRILSCCIGKTESKFPPANPKSSPAPPPVAERQLPIPKPAGQNKAAKVTPGPTLQEVIDEAEAKTGISVGGRMDEGSKTLREDDEDMFGFEHIPEDVSPPWFPNNLWGIPSTMQHNNYDWETRIGTQTIPPAIWTQQCQFQCMWKASRSGQPPN